MAATDEGAAQSSGSLDATVDASDPLLGAGTREGSFEHRRILSAAKQLLFGKGAAMHIGRYRVRRGLGAGGMGEVYLAQDEELGRDVAIKRVGSRVSSPSEQARLRREARALARVSHPNVVQIFEVGEEEGQTFLVMEYVEGETLGQWLAREARSWREVLAHFMAAGRGLAAAHEVGLIHRDFKPDNVLLGRSGDVRVADFGLVLAGEELASTGTGPGKHPGKHEAAGVEVESLASLGARVTVYGAVHGTIRYMPLEQLRAQTVDARSDQFSFCVALYEALWDGPPFACETTLARYQALREGTPFTPRTRRGGPPAALWRVIRRGLSRDPQARWPDMNALLAALDAAARQRRRFAWAGVGLASVLSLTTLFVATREAPVDPCALIERELDGSWDDARRAEFDAQLSSLEAGASESLSRVVAGLERWSSGRVEAREQVCRGQQTHSIAPELARQRELCLTRQRQAVADLIGLLDGQRLDGETLAGAVELVAELPTAASCEEELALLGVTPPPAEQEAQVEALRRELERAHQLRLLGRYDEGFALAEGLDADASALGYGPLQAETRAELAKAELEGGSLERGREQLQAAIDMAELNRHDSLAADLWISMAMRSLLDHQEVERGAWELARAEVANGRVGARPRAQGRLAYARGRLALFRGELEVAEADLREAIARTGDDQQAALDRPDYLLGLVELMIQRGDEPPLELLREAVAQSEDIYGPRHPKGAKFRYKLATTLQELDPNSAEALELFEAAAESWNNSHGRVNPDLASAKLILATTALQRGELERAEAHTREAMEVQAQTLPELHFERARAEHLLLLIATQRGEHPSAVVHARQGLAILERLLSSDDSRVVRVRADLVSSLLALGRLLEAQHELEVIPRELDSVTSVFVQLNRCELALRLGDLPAAAAELAGVPASPGLEFHRALLGALIELRAGEDQHHAREHLQTFDAHQALPGAQLDAWLEQLEVDASERVALGL